MQRDYRRGSLASAKGISLAQEWFLIPSSKGRGLIWNLKQKLLSGGIKSMKRLSLSTNLKWDSSKLLALYYAWCKVMLRFWPFSLFCRFIFSLHFPHWPLYLYGWGENCFLPDPTFPRWLHFQKGWNFFLSCCCEHLSGVDEVLTW